MSSDKHIRSAIIDVYNRTVGKAVDSKTLTYLAASIAKGENSIEQITQTLIKTSEYKERIKGIYHILHYDQVGRNPTDEEFAMFWESIDNDQVILDNPVMEAYIKTTPAFRNKYADIIKTLFATHKPNVTLTPDVIGTFMTRFQNAKYDYDALSRDIIAYESHAASPPLQPSVLSGVQERQAAPEASPTIVQVPHKPVLDIDKLTSFEKTFNRPMYVKEYFKYVVDAQKDYFTNLSALSNEHDSYLNRMRNVYANYCSIILSEHAFVNDHLLSIDQPDYFDSIVTHIVTTPEYETNMKTMLASYYKKLYDLEMDAPDLHYLFGLVKVERLHPRDEKLVDILKDFKAQTDVFIENIFNVYKRVLERQPDIYELEENLDYYRFENRTANIEVINNAVAIKLANTLEFHDIIKKHIKTLYVEKYGKDISPSKLFGILQQVLRLPDVTIDNLDTFVSNLL